jgi:hypothetical protein
MVKLTNKANGPRSVHTSTGFVTIGAGQTSADLDISEADMAAIEKFGVLDEANTDPSAPRAIPGYPNLSLPEQPAPVAPAETGETGETGAKSLDSQNKAELTATAEAEGVTVEDGMTKADIVAAIEAKRGEANA